MPDTLINAAENFHRIEIIQRIVVCRNKYIESIVIVLRSCQFNIVCDCVACVFVEMFSDKRNQKKY